MKKIIALLWACLLFAAGVKAQNTVDLQFAPTSFKQVGPSPQAAAMTRYADTPVSYGLGLAQVSIPLYEVKSRSLTLPVSLSYDSSGVRVDAVSGPVGLNWALVSGGAITRTVIGYPDEAYNGWNDSDPEYGYDLTQDNASTANTLKRSRMGNSTPVATGTPTTSADTPARSIMSAERSFPRRPPTWSFPARPSGTKADSSSRTLPGRSTILPRRRLRRATPA